MVTVVDFLAAQPTREQAQQLIAVHLDRLHQVYNERFGIDGSIDTWYWMSFPPGEYAPSKAGVVLDRTRMGGPPGAVPWAFGLTDDRPPEGSPWCLWVIQSDPDAADEIDHSPPRPGSRIQVQISDDEGNFPDDP